MSHWDGDTVERIIRDTSHTYGIQPMRFCVLQRTFDSCGEAKGLGSFEMGEAERKTRPHWRSESGRDAQSFSALTILLPRRQSRWSFEY
jgi:hypothetical protein